MTRPLPIVAAILFAVGAAGCPGPAKPEPTTGAGSGSGPAPLAKRISLAWGIQPTTVNNEAMADLYLALTDERGQVASHELGRWKGTCEVIVPTADMHALTGMRCRNGGTGTELHVTTQGGDTIIVLQMGWDEGAPSDPMAREEVKRISVPLGVGISVDPVLSTTGAPGVR
ncbi:MAG: hypothetical protein AB7T06_46810 [Kofleriaceae bacterium]